MITYLVNITFTHFLLDLSSDAKEEFSALILGGLKRQQELRYQFPIVAFGEIKYCVFISIPDIKTYSLQEQIDYVYAAASRDESKPIMMISLQYDSNNSLIFAKGEKFSFSDVKGTDIERLKTYGQEKAKDWVQLAIKKSGKIGRNDCCPCGSGKKYKYCCGRG